MTASRPTQRYTTIAMVLHWLVAALIAISIIIIWCVELVPDGAVRPIIDTHKSIGITVLGLVLLRVLWRLANPPPPLPEDYSPLEKRGAHVAHFALYVLILALPLTGWLHDSAFKDAAKYPMTLFYLVPWPRIGFIQSLDAPLKQQVHVAFGAAHVWLSYLLYALFLLHVGAALKHQFLDRQPELERMLPGKF